MRKRLDNIDLIKFLLAIVITVYHARTIVPSDEAYFTRGYFAVDAFFIISGYFMAAGEDKKGLDTFTFIKNKYLGFFQMHAISFAMAFCAVCYLRNIVTLTTFDGEKLINTAILALPEFLLLPPMSNTGYSLASITGVEWYLAAMIWGMLFIYPFLHKYKEKFVRMAAPTIFVMSLGYLYMNNKASLNANSSADGIFFKLGVVRAVGVLCLGIFIYGLVKYINELKPSVKNNIVGGIGEIICWAVVFYYMNSNLESKYDFAVIYFLAIGTMISFSQFSVTNKIIRGKFFGFLGKLSFPIYLSQSWVRKVFTNHTPDLTYKKTLLLFTAVIIVVSLVVLLIDWIINLIKKANKKTA